LPNFTWQILCFANFYKDMPSKKRLHLQQSSIISIKHVSWNAKSHTHRLQSSLIHQNKVTMRPYLPDEICKITHTSILLAGRRSCCTWSSNKLHFYWRLRDLISGMTN
jgi:hypothetical protein